MNIHACSFASKSFLSKQKIQKNFFLKVGFQAENIHLYNPENLDSKFFKSFPDASEINRYGWYAFKPFLILSILQKLKNDDILFYLDVNDKPLFGIKDYLKRFFLQNINYDFLAPLTNYPSFKFTSKFHKSNLSPEILIASLYLLADLNCSASKKFFSVILSIVII